jgi:hypothetical protein
MFIGHFGVAFGAKPLAPKVSLGAMFMAAQFLDLLWPTLLLLGLESVRIAPGATAVTPLLFEHYPISHSLLTVAGWSLGFAIVHWLLYKNRSDAIILGLLVLSHWVLDLIVHQPDLPLAPGSSIKVGLNLWSSLPGTMLVEMPIFAIGIWFYLRATKPLDRSGVWGLWSLVLFLLVIYFGNFFGPPPPDVKTIAWAGHAQWLLVLWAYWVDQHRQPTVLPEVP